MAQFVTHIQPTLVEASQGHVPHHHGHQIGFSHSSHLPHSGHNMPSPPTLGNHHHGHQYAQQHYSSAARREKNEHHHHHHTSADQHQHPQFYNTNRHARHAYDHYTSGHQFSNTVSCKDILYQKKKHLCNVLGNVFFLLMGVTVTRL